MTSRWAVTAAIAVDAVIIACSPAAPTCKDQSGRGVTAPTNLDLTCTPSGTDVQCRAIANAHNELYVYCPIPDQDVTDEASWTSSNPSIATFTARGTLKTVSPGRVEVSATWHYITTLTFAFTVAPGTPAERMSKLYVYAYDATTHSFTGLPGVSVEVVPERGPMQTCLTNQSGRCDPMWLLSGTVRVNGTKAGYQPLQISVAPSASFSQAANLALTPVSTP